MTRTRAWQVRWSHVGYDCDGDIPGYPRCPVDPGRQRGKPHEVICNTHREAILLVRSVEAGPSRGSVIEQIEEEATP